MVGMSVGRLVEVFIFIELLLVLTLVRKRRRMCGIAIIVEEPTARQVAWTG